MNLVVYLAGEIHTEWRDEVKSKFKHLDFTFVGPQVNHDLSDNIGEVVQGEQANKLAKDQAASDINNFRTQLWMNKADLVIAKFGEEYKQWNTVMDATRAIEHGKPLIIIRPESAIHALKELENRANVTVETIDQAVEVLKYALK